MSFSDQIADIEFRLGNQVLEGTGFLVGPNHLITNTHVMFDDFGRSNFSLGFEMTVRFEDGEVARPLPGAPFRFFNNPDFFDGDNLISNRNTQFDFAFVHLDRNVGDRNGFFGFASGEDRQPSKLNIAGFPSGRFDGDTLRHDFVDVSYNTSNGFAEFVSAEVEPGSSGSPLWFLTNSGNRIVTAINSTGSGFNHTAGLITDFMFDEIKAFVSVKLPTNDSDRITGTQKKDRVSALDGNDVVSGRDGNDRLRGDDGNDRLKGGADDDRLFGGDDKDRLFGGSDDDVLVGSSGNDRLVGNTGNDDMKGGGDDDGMAGNDGKDTMFGGGGDDKMFGGGGRDRVNGDAGDDRVEGGGGDDRVYGGDGDDLLRGNKDKDRLSGGRDDDHLDGGEGNDRMNGGSGEDTFHFDKGDDVDRIVGFQQGIDVIEFGKGVNSFRQIDIEQDGAHTAISYAGGTIILLRQDADDFTADDFIF